MSRSNVLIVEDERGLADLYAEWLTGEYTVRTAYNGEQAMEETGNAVDIVLLDRSLPDLSGDEILAHIREEDYDCRVIMVTAVEPDTELLDLEFDDYLIKPVNCEEFCSAIERVKQLETYDDPLQELYRCIATRSALDQRADISLTEHGSYSDLLDRIETLEERVDSTIEAFHTEEFEVAYRAFTKSHSHDEIR